MRQRNTYKPLALSRCATLRVVPQKGARVSVVLAGDTICREIEAYFGLLVTPMEQCLRWSVGKVLPC